MHFGETRKPHIHTINDLTMLGCYCGWRSGELTIEDLQNRGLPWYCDDCGTQGLRFITFGPAERADAYREWGIDGRT